MLGGGSDGKVSCNFNVTVAPPPHLETRTLAFGDSITFRISTGICPFGTSGLHWTPIELLSSSIGHLAQVSNPYPLALQGMLRERYTAQSPTVFNAGLSWRVRHRSDTRRRFTRAAQRAEPGDRAAPGRHQRPSRPACRYPARQGLRLVRDALRAMSLEARGRGMQVFLGTLLPQRPNGCRAFAIPPRRPTQTSITPTNDLIRSMAAAEGHRPRRPLRRLQRTLTTDFLAQDGLHPSDAGYAAMAQAFFDAIKQKLEKPRKLHESGISTLKPAVRRHHARPHPVPPDRRPAQRW